MITMTLSKGQVEDFSNSLSDILCWINGFKAAHIHSDEPLNIMGTEGLITLNLLLKNELNKLEE